MDNNSVSTPNANPQSPPPVKCKDILCNFYGSEKTEGYCSVCYKDIVKNNKNNKISEENLIEKVRESSPPKILEKPAPPAAPKKSSTPVKSEIDDNTMKLKPISSSTAKLSIQKKSPASSSPTIPSPKKKKTRCLICKKKLGITGFDCRCGGMFCSLHRFEDQHNCNFDFKTTEREKLAKDNQKVEDAKIEKI